MELCACPACGLPAEVVSDADEDDVFGPAAGQLVGVRCVGEHWFFGLRDRLVA